MTFAYAITPIITWLLVGPIKFLINSARSRQWAFNLIGNGGFPSNHSAVVTSTATLIALREGISHPAFGVAVAFALIVMIDANSLRQHVGRQAATINKMALQLSPQPGEPLRERMGHSMVEIIGGIATGVLVGYAINSIF